MSIIDAHRLFYYLPSFRAEREKTVNKEGKYRSAEGRSRWLRKRFYSCPKCSRLIWNSRATCSSSRV
jgi:hypothetical protein